MRDFPSVEELLQAKELTSAVASVPRAVAAGIIKDVVASCKETVGTGNGEMPLAALTETIKNSIRDFERRRIGRVINATGTVVHTNLGRAPLGDELLKGLNDTVAGYCNLEFETDGGGRGSRGEVCERYLVLLSGAESATVVNNCAAALFLILNSLANRRKVIISRGELVQIGGGFRIQDILKKAGARLCEIGATNITTLSDYENAIDDNTALILKVHQSNFVQSGFVEQVSLSELVACGKKHNVPVINDLGSGVFVPTRKIIGSLEPTVMESVKQSADLTCFSGDKLLGGPQSGLIVGKAELIKKIKKNPLFRTMRVDKIIFTLLERLLGIYLEGSHLENIPLWKLLNTNESELYKRGKKLLNRVGQSLPEVTVEATQAFIGGGALPEHTVPSVGIIFSGKFKARKLSDQFRRLDPPVIGRIVDDRFVLDLKAVPVEELGLLAASIKKVLASKSIKK